MATPAQLIQSGVFNKTESGTMTINFPTQFGAPPTVVVSPYWPGTNQVGNIETVTAVTSTSFNVSSGNYGAQYFVNWVAVGTVNT